MASKAFRQNLEERTRNVSRHFCSAGKIGSGTYGVVYKVLFLSLRLGSTPPKVHSGALRRGLPIITEDDALTHRGICDAE